MMLLSLFPSLLAKFNPSDAGIFETTLTLTNVQSVANAVFGIAGAVAVMFIIIGGISYTIANGEQGKIKQARDTILYAVVGLVLVIASFTIMQFVLGRF